MDGQDPVLGICLVVGIVGVRAGAGVEISAPSDLVLHLVANAIVLIAKHHGRRKGAIA